MMAEKRVGLSFLCYVMSSIASLSLCYSFVSSKDHASRRRIDTDSKVIRDIGTVAFLSHLGGSIS